MLGEDNQSSTIPQTNDAQKILWEMTQYLPGPLGDGSQRHKATATRIMFLRNRGSPCWCVYIEYDKYT